MAKTPVTYKETKLGVLEIQEIEKIITENLALVQKFLIRNAARLPINQETAKKFHSLLAGSLYEEAGQYRKHNVQLGEFEPPIYFEVPVLMKNWEDDLQERRKHAKRKSVRIENCAWLIHRFLWIHPFFDYNGRVSRLLGELYLIKNKLPVVDFRQTKRNDFVEAVKEATKTQNLKELKELLAGGGKQT